MPQSTFLARLIGPVLMIIGLGLLINAPYYRVIASQVVQTPGLIFISGILTLLGGLAVVLAHNVWDGSWRVIVTVVGWVGIAGGVVRVLAPQQITSIGASVVVHPAFPVAGACLILVLGAVLAYFGYADAPSTRSRQSSRPARKRSR